MQGRHFSGAHGRGPGRLSDCPVDNCRISMTFADVGVDYPRNYQEFRACFPDDASCAGSPLGRGEVHGQTNFGSMP